MTGSSDCDLDACAPREERGLPMRGFAGWIVLGAVACLACGLQAEERVGSSLATAPPPLPGIGSHDPRIRVDPDVGPWRAVGKLQAASIDFRTLCTATLVGP